METITKTKPAKVAEATLSPTPQMSEIKAVAAEYGPVSIEKRKRKNFILDGSDFKVRTYPRGVIQIHAKNAEIVDFLLAEESALKEICGIKGSTDTEVFNVTPKSVQEAKALVLQMQKAISVKPWHHKADAFFYMESETIDKANVHAIGARVFLHLVEKS